jgi:hypothetical protein
MTLAPITLFVYNRPVHTRLTVEALKKNDLAKDSHLIVFSDAPKSESQAEAVREVRKYIRSITGFRSVSIVEREWNWGLANSIIDGVTSLVNKFGRVIVLEDDLLTSPHFLAYMNTSLETYQNEERVMSITGYMFPIDNSGLPETFFLKILGCWGWATWDRAWKYFEKDPKNLLESFSQSEIDRFNLEGAYDFWSQVQQNESGKINTWAIFWYTSMFQKDGLSLHPAFSMVDNIGNDNSGVHCSKTNNFNSALAKNPIMYFEGEIAENSLARDRLRKFLLSTRRSNQVGFYQQIKAKLIRAYQKK